NSDNSNRSKEWKMSAEYNHFQNYTHGKPRIPTTFSLRYSFGLSDNQGSGRTRTSFVSLKDPSQNRDYDRLYDQSDNHQFTQTIFAEYPDLNGLIFGRVNLGGVRMGINNTLNLTNENAQNQVRDINTATGQYELNTYLTNS